MTDRPSQESTFQPSAEDEPLLVEAQRVYRQQTYAGSAPAWTHGLRRLRLRAWAAVATVVLVLATATVIWRLGGPPSADSGTNAAEMVIAESPWTGEPGERPEPNVPLPEPVVEGGATQVEVSGGAAPPVVRGPEPVPEAAHEAAQEADALLSATSTLDRLPVLRRRALELRPATVPRPRSLRLRSVSRPTMPRPPASAALPTDRSGR